MPPESALLNIVRKTLPYIAILFVYFLKLMRSAESGASASFDMVISCRWLTRQFLLHKHACRGIHISRCKLLFVAAAVVLTHLAVYSKVFDLENERRVVTLRHFEKSSYI